MEMQQVRYFLAVCQEQNFTRAARCCGVSQPSLSLAIRNLERDLGGPLFYRGVRSSTLTELGFAVRPFFKKVLEGAEAALREAARLRSSRLNSSNRTRLSAAAVRRPGIDIIL